MLIFVWLLVCNFNINALVKRNNIHLEFFFLYAFCMMFVMFVKPSENNKIKIQTQNREEK